MFNVTTKKSYHSESSSEAARGLTFVKRGSRKGIKK